MGPEPPSPVALVALALVAVLLGAGAAPVVADRPQVDPPELPDQTPYGIETVYGNPDLVATAGGSGVDVAVLDSGVDRDHPDLRRRVERCRDYTLPRVREGRCTDADGHGTHVAGVVLADGGPDGEGLYGVAPAADLWAFKVCDREGACSSRAVARAVRDATDEGAEIVLISLGGERSDDLQRALQYAEDGGVLLVGAAGNAGPGLGTVEYPASDPAVVAVGAVVRTAAGTEPDPAAYSVPAFSSRGVNDTAWRRQSGYLEVAAPGVGIVSAWRDDGYREKSGTSFAAPHVAGVAARLWTMTDDRNGDGNRNDDVRRALRSAAAGFDLTRGDHARRGYDPAAGLGVPRVASARADVGVDPGVPVVGEPATLEAEPRSTAPVASYAWDLDGDGAPDATGERVTTSFGSAGQVSVGLRVTGTDGVVSRTVRSVRINAPPTADFVVEPAVPVAGEPVRLSAAGSADPDGPIASYEWDLDGDGATDARGPAVDTTFDRVGNRTVTLRVVDGDGATATATRPVVVNDRPSIDVPATVRATPGRPVTLSAAVTDGVGAVSVVWAFPDGGTATGPTVTWAFGPGDHRVRVTATDEYGASASAVVTVTARTEPNPTPTPTPPPGPAMPGFTPVTAMAALVALVGLARLVARRRGPG